MIYLDANLFVFANFDPSEKGLKARKLQREIVSGMNAITSVLTLDEVMRTMIKNKKQVEIRSMVEEIYATPNLSVKDVPSHTALHALDLMEKYALKPRDAFHAAIMRSLGIEKIVSDDPHFDRIK